MSFFEKAGEFSQDFTEPILLLGDLNARCGAFTGDHSFTPQGRWLMEKLEQIPVYIVPPNQGKYTTLSGGGRGITDHVLTNDVPVSEYIVHEDESLGGSDHRPLTFVVPDPADFQKKAFERWNVRKLADPEIKERFTTSLNRSCGRTRTRIIELAGEIQDQEIPHDRKQEVIDTMWSEIKDWYSQAATDSCGRFTFKSYVRKDFWTDELMAKKAECLELNQTLVDLINSRRPVGIRMAAQTRLNKANQEYREMLTVRRSAIFEDVVNDLSNPQNAGAFMRMVKGINK
jgi:hypothetical protein